jgi:hypothetical protein
MGFKTAEEAYENFLQTGQYMNNDSHFDGTPEERRALFGAYKHMVPKDVKVAFREKVANNERNAIEGLMEGRSLESQGIYNKKEEGQALWRRINAGLGTGLDMNKAYDWDGGTAREVGTTDMAKWGTNRGITSTEQQRWNDFRAAGSAQNYWAGYRQNQLAGLEAQGAIRRDPATGGWLNPGPGGQDRYGAQGQGYNFGAGPLGRSTGPSSYGGGGGQTPSYSPGSYNSPYNNQPARPAAPAGAPKMPNFTAGTGQVNQAPAPSTPSFTPPRGGGFTGGMDRKNQLGVISAASGYSNPVMPAGPLPGGGTPMVVHPGENVQVTPANQNPAFGGQGSAGQIATTQGLPSSRPAGSGGTTREIGPGQAGIPGNMPNGRSPFDSNPMPMPTGTGIVWGPNGPTSGGGGNLSPNLPGINPPGQIPMNQWGAGTPWGQGLQGAGQMDNAGQGFSLDRAQREYGGSFGPEQTLMNYYGQALGVDATTGQPLQGQALDASNRASFGMLAPQAQRLSGDTEAAVEAIKAQLPPGGARDAAIAEAIRGGQTNMLGLRQNQAAEARQGLSQIMAMKKGFDPAAYQGGNQALLGAEVGTRGQDLQTLLGQRGQDIEALLGQRGQDVQWGLGWGGLANSASQNLWDSYFTGRGQDLGQYANLRGQDLNYQAQQAQLKAQRDAANKGFWGNLLGTVGTVAGGLIGGPPGAAIGGAAGRGASGGW